MKHVSRFVVCVLFLCLPTARAADDDPRPEGKPQLFAEPKKDWAWDEDKRFDFLMERLASLEASLDAVESAIAKTSGKRGLKLGDARRAEANNTMMDRKGGGPMKWNEFYGTTAEKFFYHPVDPNTSYHTETALRQMGNAQDSKVAEGVPASQSVPVHQRPPQFDYIYRANRDAKERADIEAAALQGKLDELNFRRTRLEEEQAELWCRLAFRPIQRLNIPRKPVLRFRLEPPGTEGADLQRTAALQAAAKFLATAMVIIEKAETDQATAFGNIRTIVTNARNDLDDSLVSADGLAEEAQDRKTNIGKFVALAQLLDDTSNNLSESFVVAMDGDRFKDVARKERFRGLLQRSLVDYAQIILALDELTGGMKTEWAVKVNTKDKAPAVEVSWGPASVKRSSVEAPGLEDDGIGEQADPEPRKTGATTTLLKKKLAGKASYNPKTLELSLGYDFSNRNQLRDFDSGEAQPKCLNRSLELAAGEGITHVAEFQTVRVSGVVAIRNLNQTAPLATTTGIKLFFGRDGSERYLQLGLGHNPQGDAEASVWLPDITDLKGAVPFELNVTPSRCSLKIGTSTLGKEVTLTAGRIQFNGGSGGTAFGRLSMAGKVDEEWATSFFSE